MRFAGINNLRRAGILGNLAQPVQIRQDEVGALVYRGAPREANRKYFGVKMEAGLRADHFEQFVFGDKMRCPNILGGQAESASQTEIVLTPGWNVAVEELLERRACPGTGVNAIGDGFDRHFREHLTRSFAVLLCHSVDVSAQAQRKLGHVHGSSLARRFLQTGNILLRLQDSLHQISSRSVTQVKKVDLL